MSEAVSEPCVVLEKDGFVSRLTINRPKVLNALDRRTLEELHGAVEKVAADRATRVLILQGAGDKAFVAGADIAGMAKLTPVEAHTLAAYGHALMGRLEELRVPVIARVQGFALGGGCELALACDLVVASTAARFGQPEVNLGVIPGFGGTQRLTRRVGPGAARRLVLTGEIIGAQEAHRIGLVDVLTSPEELDATVTALAATLAAKGPVAVSKAKELIRTGADQPLADANRAEAKAFGDLFATGDQKEGMAAFLEKRAAKFSGT